MLFLSALAEMRRICCGKKLLPKKISEVWTAGKGYLKEGNASISGSASAPKKKDISKSDLECSNHSNPTPCLHGEARKKKRECD